MQESRKSLSLYLFRPTLNGAGMFIMDVFSRKEEAATIISISNIKESQSA
jgi:hypothetical protein